MSAADLEALALAADTLQPIPEGEGEASQGAKPPEPEESPEDRNTRAIGLALALFREVTASDLIFRPGLRTLKERMPDQVIEKLARPWAKVATAYGVDLLAGIDRPELEAIMLTGPVLWGIGRALALELKERRPVEGATRESPDSHDPGRPE